MPRGVLHVFIGVTPEAICFRTKSRCSQREDKTGCQGAHAQDAPSTDDRSEADSTVYAFPGSRKPGPRYDPTTLKWKAILFLRLRPSCRLLSPQARKSHPSPMAPLSWIPPLRLKNPSRRECTYEESPFAKQLAVTGVTTPNPVRRLLFFRNVWRVTTNTKARTVPARVVCNSFACQRFAPPRRLCFCFRFNALAEVMPVTCRPHAFSRTISPLLEVYQMSASTVTQHNNHAHPSRRRGASDSMAFCRSF